jgi:hypothetical protein
MGVGRERWARKGRHSTAPIRPAATPAATHCITTAANVVFGEWE